MRPGAEQEPGSHAAHVRVVLVAAAADLEAARHIAAHLRGRGVDASVDGAPGSRAALVVLSPAALGDGRWRSRVDELGAAHLVPVELEPVDGPAVPAPVRPLHPIRWSPDEADRAADAILAALAADRERCAMHRSLAGEARRWASSGREDDLLIQEPARARAAQAHVAATRSDPVVRTTPELAAFVAASTSRGRARAHRRASRWALGAVALAAVVGVCALVVVLLRGESTTEPIPTADIDLLAHPDRPERAGMLAAAALVQGFPIVNAVAHDILMEALSQPWPDGVIGATLDAPIVDAMLLGDGYGLVTADGRGTLTTWDRASGQAVARRAVAATPLTAVDGTRDASTLVAAAGTAVWIVRRGGPARRAAIGAPVSRVALAPARRVAVAQTPEELAVVDLASLAVVRRIEGQDGVLDLRQTADGGARALVRTRAGGLAIVDAVTGAIRASGDVPRVRARSGALDPRGTGAAVVGADGQVSYAPAGLRLAPTGIAASEAARVALLRDGMLAVAAPESGVRVVDPRSGLVVGAICRSSPSAVALRAAPWDATTLCLDGRRVELWRTEALRPRGEAPPATLLSSLTDTRHGRTRVRVRGDTVELRSTIDPAFLLEARSPGTRFTAVALHPSERFVAAGTDDGRVLSFDLLPRFAPTLTWRSPDGSAVRALGWSAGGDELTIVGTASGRWWTAPACLGCSGEAAIARVRSRLGVCQQASALRSLTDTTREALGVSACTAPPRPERG